MGVSMPLAAGRGGRKGLTPDVNVVPFIDLMSTCITFLLLTAVWTQTTTLQVAQATLDCMDCWPPAPKLVLHVTDLGVWMGRDPRTGHFLPKLPAGYDWDALDAALEADRALYPGTRDAVLRTDDGIAYGHMVRALDLAKASGFDRTILAGGPADATPLGSARSR
jgi:biopolymer transport protein ExbD